MKKTFPFHFIVGIILLVLSGIFLSNKIEPFYSWYYCFAWWPYILAVDGVIYRIKGNSLILNRTREFFLMIPWSIFIWLIFEAANLALKNWYYIYLPHSTVERWLGYAIAFGTVLPGIFETTELLETLGLFKDARTRAISMSAKGRSLLMFLGALCLLASILCPRYFFPLIWVGFIFLLEPLNERFGKSSILKGLEEGNPRKIYLLLAAGLICGILWEFWNYWARSKWIYTVPFFEEMKGFEMPFPGFLGFPFFAVQVFIMYRFISLFRFSRGWEEFTCRLSQEKKTGPLTILLTWVLIISFSILIFTAIDRNTVDSYNPRLKDAYWIEPQHLKELPKVGIATLNDLILKTEDKTERDELALRLLIPKEEFIQWVAKAQLAETKGIGIGNLRLLERMGISSLSALAMEDPERLYKKMKETYLGGQVPAKAKIKIWIKEARKNVSDQ
jgi:hypothetical protein